MESWQKLRVFVHFDILHSVIKDKYKDDKDPLEIAGLMLPLNVIAPLYHTTSPWCDYGPFWEKNNYIDVWRLLISSIYVEEELQVNILYKVAFLQSPSD